MLVKDLIAELKKLDGESEIYSKWLSTYYEEIEISEIDGIFQTDYKNNTTKEIKGYVIGG